MIYTICNVSEVIPPQPSFSFDSLPNSQTKHITHQQKMKGCENIRSMSLGLLHYYSLFLSIIYYHYHHYLFLLLFSLPHPRSCFSLFLITTRSFTGWKHHPWSCTRIETEREFNIQGQNVTCSRSIESSIITASSIIQETTSFLLSFELNNTRSIFLSCRQKLSFTG